MSRMRDSTTIAISTSARLSIFEIVKTADNWRFRLRAADGPMTGKFIGVTRGSVALDATVRYVSDECQGTRFFVVPTTSTGNFLCCSVASSNYWLKVGSDGVEVSTHPVEIHFHVDGQLPVAQSVKKVATMVQPRKGRAVAERSMSNDIASMTESAAGDDVVSLSEEEVMEIVDDVVSISSSASRG